MPLLARLLAPILVVAATAAPAAVAAPPKIGLADQQGSAFGNPLFKAMGITYGRVTIPWNAASGPGFRRDDADAVVSAMKAGGVEPVAVIGSRDSGRPTIAKYRRAADALIKRYPTVRYWSPWNEANLASFTRKDPRLVAEWTRVLQAACKKAKPRCTVASPTVLDEASIGAWFTRYLGYLPRSQRPKIWLMHNYLDANRFRVKNGKPFLVAARKARAQVWIVETGGLMKGKGKNSSTWPKGQAQQVKVFDWLTGTLPRQYPVVRRIYIYQWQAPPKGNWDSGILSPSGEPREIYDVMLDYLEVNPEN